IPAVSIYLKSGVPGRLSPDIEAIFAEAQNSNPRRKECHTDSGELARACLFGGETLGAVVIGDSHAASIVTAVAQALPSPDLHVLAMTLSGCPTIEGIKRVGDSRLNCEAATRSLISQLEELPHDVPVILSNRYSAIFWGENEASQEVAAVPNHYLTQPYSSRTDSYHQEINNGY